MRQRVAISPIVGGAPVKGPADAAAARSRQRRSPRAAWRALYRRPGHGAYVLDERDAKQVEDIESLGLRARAVDSIMRDTRTSARLAEAALSLARELR